MKRILGVAAAMALAIGCRGPSQVYDPFLGRTTVDPPGTATPPPGQPYYGAPPATAPTMAPPPGAAATPVPRYGSPNFSPTPAGGAGLSSSFTPNVSSPAQITPAAAAGRAAAPPFTPVSNSTRPAYNPPGAGGYPQARNVHDIRHSDLGAGGFTDRRGSQPAGCFGCRQNSGHAQC